MFGDVLIFISPTYVLAIVVASVYGLAFFLFLGQGWGQLILYWVVAIAGFLVGQTAAESVGIGIYKIGATNLVEGTLISALALIATRTWVLRSK